MIETVMFGLRKVPKRISVSRSGGIFAARIERQRARGFYIWSACLSTSMFALFCVGFVPAIWRHPDSAPYLLPIVVLALICYLIALAIALWAAFGVEDITVEGGELRWTMTVLRWGSKLAIPTSEIAEIKAITPWHGIIGSCSVELAARGQRWEMGERLFPDEAIELADRLRQAVDEQRPSK